MISAAFGDFQVEVLSDRELFAIIRDGPFAPMMRQTGHCRERTARGYAVVPIQLGDGRPIQTNQNKRINFK
jgi:hypothetical protein